MQYTIYQTTNQINGKIYIGKHETQNPDDSYLGSGVALNRAIKKHGRENFVKEVLFVFDTAEEMYAKEIELVDEAFINRPDTYNMIVGGQGLRAGHLNTFYGRKHSEETKKQIAENTKKALATPDIRKKMANHGRKNPMYGKSRPELMAALKALNTGKKHTEEHKAKIGATIKGRKHSEEAKEKMREAMRQSHARRKATL